MLFTISFVSVVFSAMFMKSHASGPRVQCAQNVTADAGDSCSDIATANGISLAKLESINPDVDCNSTLADGTGLCLREYTATCYVNDTATETACSPLLTTWNITQANFVLMNDNVNDACDDLTVGSNYCVSTDYCTANPTDGMCTSGV